MAETVICAACGAKIKGGRSHCLRCGEALDVAPPPAPPSGWRGFVAAHRGPLAIGGAAFGLLVVVVLIAPRVQERPDLSVASALPSLSSSAVAATAPAVDGRTPVLLEPRTPLDIQRLGTAAYMRGDFAGALESYQQAVALNPNDATALNNLGQALVRVGRAMEALQYFERAAVISPTEWTPRFNLAHAYGEMGDWTHAVTEYERAVELFPEDYVTHYNLALAFHKAGREEPAVAEYRRAIELAPGEASFRLSLGISYERLQRPIDAAAAYEEYLDLAPDAADASKVKARIETLRKPAQAEQPTQPAQG